LPGLTLIEVMAGLAILGTLLASLVVARGRYLHQWTLAGQKQQAVQAADQLLAGWWADPQKFPRQQAGELPKSNLQWRTSVLDSKSATDLKVQIIRLELFEKRENADRIATDGEKQSPLVQVDVVLNPPKAASKDTGASNDSIMQSSTGEVSSFNPEGP
jgi:prepilin-type N-terminal cleavage/methylation domain-containing protein